MRAVITVQVLGIISEQFDTADEICGAVVSIRYQERRSRAACALPCSAIRFPGWQVRGEMSAFCRRMLAAGGYYLGLEQIFPRPSSDAENQGYTEAGSGAPLFDCAGVQMPR